MYRHLILIFFVSCSVCTSAISGIMPKDSGDQYELSYWESVRNSRFAADYEAYVQAYPNGRFVGLARTRLERIRGRKPRASAYAGGTTQESSRRWRRPPEPVTSDKQPDIAAAAAATTALTELEAALVNASPITAAKPASILEISDCTLCPVLVAVPEGGFRMGSNVDDAAASPEFHVTITTPFAIGKYEVTLAQWNACVADGGCAQLSNDASRAPNSPVRDVSWEDARKYIIWLSKISDSAYRLPTEAEWEYAARGGTSERYWWGSSMKPGVANCRDCGSPWSETGPTSVGSFAANGYGLYDVSGSLWEWVSDCWHNSYQRAPSNGQSWEEASCTSRVLRGGSWTDGAAKMAVSTRMQGNPNERQPQNGFRVARNLN